MPDLFSVCVYIGSVEGFKLLVLIINTFANSTADGMLGKRDTEKTPCSEHSFVLKDRKPQTMNVWWFGVG